MEVFQVLVIGRKIDEEIIIRLGGGETIKIKVQAVYSDRCRLGFTAPEHVQINRLELDKAKFPES
jgi:carbon storage regulator CsrA